MNTINYNMSSLYSFLKGCEDFVFLDTSKVDGRNRRSLLFHAPIKRLQFFQGQDVGVFLDNVQKLQRQGFYLAGWFSYEFGYALEPSLNSRMEDEDAQKTLLADLGVFDDCHSFDHVSGENDFPGGEEIVDLGDYRVSDIRPSQEKQEYLQALEKVLAYIEAGDTYQVNYTLKLFFDFQGSPEKFYDSLRRNQSVSYGAYIRRQDKRIMSFSPELFFWKKGGEVTVRPMKGTVKRGKTVEEDNELRDFLKTDVKNQSENVMIVDLLRNDLGHLMHKLSGGDVGVDSLFDVETYETLLQMTSTITGKSSPQALNKVSLLDFFQAIFPCGSVTGAPKIRTMEIIDELEKDKRGVYTGAIGCLLPDGEAVFNVPIRTVVLEGKKGEMGIGSGIVHDSDPVQEWQECLLKGRFLTAPQRRFRLIETVLWSPALGYFLLDAHLERLSKSAGYFLFQCDCDEIRKALDNYVEELGDSAKRVRLLLEKDGSFQLEHGECEEPGLLALPEQPELPSAALPHITLSSQRIVSESRWYYHKTTIRDLYDREFAAARRRGLFDCIFQNERGEVTEGCISNVIVYKNGSYCTPPVASGLLPGVMREYLLRDGAVSVAQKELTMADLYEAEAIFLCNSVRGLVQVALSAEDK